MDKAKTDAAAAINWIKTHELVNITNKEALINYGLEVATKAPAYSLYKGPPKAPSTPDFIEQTKSEIKRLQDQLKYLTRPKLSQSEALDVKRITDEMLSLGMFLSGSREKLKDRDYTTFRDWDFHAQWAEEHNPFEPPTSKTVEYVYENFIVQENEEAVQYKDKFFISYWKHKTYPHITIIMNSNLTLYQKMWNKLPKQYWHNYLWKSNPSRVNELKDPNALRAFKQRSRDTFNMLYEMVELEYGDCM
jgi:hypothetical protein